MAANRSHVIALMRKAFRRGQSASSFLADMKVRQLSYRRSDMFADWRSVNQVERKVSALRSVRKDRLPARTAIAEVHWALSQEFMYKVKVFSKLKPDAPMQERFVNIMSDNPMTPNMIEQAVIEKWTEWEDYTAESIDRVVPWTALRRV